MYCCYRSYYFEFPREKVTTNKLQGTYTRFECAFSLKPNLNGYNASCFVLRSTVRWWHEYRIAKDHPTKCGLMHSNSVSYNFSTTTIQLETLIDEEKILLFNNPPGIITVKFRLVNKLKRKYKNYDFGFHTSALDHFLFVGEITF